MAKLTEQRVRQLRQRWSAGESIQALADELGVSKSSAWAAATAKTWGHV